ncbi:MAG: hypothetical protein B7Z37_07345 [Verrucomicrobia bacterium 12-59-8]|nr:MAG: hypothetical protein B7Z37_07345 [Verrucomicrobia bacterium 12-59-8]
MLSNHCKSLAYLLLMAGLTASVSAAESFTVDRFNYILGTQAIGGKYQFKSQDPLVESAEVIHAMGASCMKFDLRPIPKQYPGIHSLVELARDEPAHRKVLDMPFANYQLWAEPFAGTSWKQGFSKTHAELEYQEMYDLVVHLLKTYSGTGKTFYLGHWEGDNLLRGSISKAADAQMTPERVQGMTGWLATRQRAVDAAKQDTPHQDVQVWHYTELNHPTISLREGRPTLVNQVLPQVPVDFVSYSAYDVTNEPKPEEIKAVLSYIESKLLPKPGIQGRRVFIGEYGYSVFHNGKPHHSPQEQDRLSRITIQAALEWGCPFILYWELYNNELEPDGQQRGFWMIDDKGAKQPIYETHRLYYQWARRFVAESIARTGKPPTDAEFRAAAAEYFKSQR